MGYGGVNQKAVEARERKLAAVLEKKRKEEERIEAEKWRDDDKHANRKLERKKDLINKQEEKNLRKQELKKLYEEEDAKFVSNKMKVNTGNKLTRAEIAKRTLMFAMKSSSSASNGQNDDSGHNDLLVENPNKIDKEMRMKSQESNIEYITASTLEDAVSVLTINDNAGVDKHPEKRQKAAWLAYVDNNLPILKKENPTFKRSQLLQLLQKMWKKATENPLNESIQKGL
ncbi:hypothetical protein FG386_001848 [Cryptosporidium ryanae]|uniref:uncharacterized protein n=1 Tax=Cryptosporidium ryanae TaxID=515981 RepID=UPI003519E9C6|nr:hypothetical protein FG386_001848 [Cryptosporidium ryanae]